MMFTLNRLGWKLITCLVIGLLVFLGSWQLSRAQKKAELIHLIKKRQQKPILTAQKLEHPDDWRYFRAKLTGYYDEAHTFFLDNKIRNKQIGYEIYTPFIAKGVTKPILVDRGFIPAPSYRNTLPQLNPLNNKVVLTGTISLAPTYFAWGPIHENTKLTFPLRVQYINLTELGGLISKELFPYVLVIDASQPGAFIPTWNPLNLSPERHLGYALQWFALALSLLVLFLALNYQHPNRSAKSS